MVSSLFISSSIRARAFAGDRAQIASNEASELLLSVSRKMETVATCPCLQYWQGKPQSLQMPSRNLIARSGAPRNSRFRTFGPSCHQLFTLPRPSWVSGLSVPSCSTAFVLSGGCCAARVHFIELSPPSEACGSANSRHHVGDHFEQPVLVGHIALREAVSAQPAPSKGRSRECHHRLSTKWKRAFSPLFTGLLSSNRGNQRQFKPVFHANANNT